MFPKLVVFDFDGTLVDLNQDVNRLRAKLKDLAKKYNVHLEFKPILRDIQKLGEISGDTARKEAMDILNKDDVQSTQRAELIDRSNEVCNIIKSKGIKIAIFSRNYTKAIQKSLKKFNFPKFDIILGRNGSGQTKAEQLGVILHTLNIKPSETVVVGDHILDMQAGRELGCFSVGIKNDRFNEQKLIDAGAEVVIKNIYELVEVLNL